MAQSFRELVVWQRAIQLTLAIYRLTQVFPREELYGLISQLRRAAVSLPSNNAEGHGRLNSGEFRQFLGIARASNCELQTQLHIARELKMGNHNLIHEAEELSHEVGKMIYSAVRSLNLQTTFPAAEN